mmetsp:Transcript_6124/g.13415  ORF Transcript_6124/g.13415 Transcript_6124/m.13415 type:complete len:219 (-) Transcript_6124:604-1260(-)
MHRMQQTQNRGVSQQTMMMELFGNTTIRFPYYSSRAIPTDVVSTTKRIAYYFLVSRGPLPVPSTATIGAPPWEWSVTNRGGPIVTKRASNPYYRPQHRCCHHRRQTKEAIHHFGFHPGYPIYSFIKPGTPRLQGTIIAIHGTPKYPRPCGGDPQPTPQTLAGTLVIFHAPNWSVRACNIPTSSMPHSPTLCWFGKRERRNWWQPTSQGLPGAYDSTTR